MKKVLLVDDARSVRQLFAQIIEQSGYQVHCAANAKEALEFIGGNERPDLIITDVNMPGMCGIDFAKRAREQLKGVPVLVMSTESDKRLITQGKEAGVTGWLLKPVKHETFVRQLHKFLGEGLLAS